jgi:Mn-dependent DtxR family transcriptional regulator
MGHYERVWKEFESNEITHSAAHYLLAVAAIGKAGRDPRAVDVARQLDVSRAAVSLQLRTLRGHGLVEVGDDHRIRLTRTGAEIVARIASKREAVRVFFEEILGVDAMAAERDACKIEHLISEETSTALVRFIRFLRSNDVASTDFLRRFQEAIENCPPEIHCGVCTEACLIANDGYDDDESPAS